MSEYVYQPRDVNLAFFDLDGTLVVGQTQRLLVTFLREKGMIGLGFLLGTGIWFILYRMGLVKAGEEGRNIHWTGDWASSLWFGEGARGTCLLGGARS